MTEDSQEPLFPFYQYYGLHCVPLKLDLAVLTPCILHVTGHGAFKEAKWGCPGGLVSLKEEIRPQKDVPKREVSEGSSST